MVWLPSVDVGESLRPSLTRVPLVEDDGVAYLITHFKGRRSEEPIQEVATEVDQYVNKLKRKRGEEMQNYCKRSEDLHERVVKKIRQIPGGDKVTSLFPEVMRSSKAGTCWTDPRWDLRNRRRSWRPPMDTTR